MPLYKKIQHTAQTQILVWEITESIETLQKGISLSQNSKERLEAMHSEIHQKGYLSVRHLFGILGYQDDDLFYTPDGKPHLKDGKRISISHSYQYAAIIISDFIVGIDIEKNRPKILKIAPKFLLDERAFIDVAHPVEFLTVIWGAKECLYKIYPDGGLLFKEHLPIEPFVMSDGKTRGWIKKDSFYEVYTIYFEFFNDFTLVYAAN